MLAGPSDPPDPAFNAFRHDLADVALASRVIASHYARAVARRLTAPAALRAGPSSSSDCLCALEAGDPFEMLDCRVGWAWGYAGLERRVGYVSADVLGTP